VVTRRQMRGKPPIDCDPATFHNLFRWALGVIAAHLADGVISAYHRSPAVKEDCILLYEPDILIRHVADNAIAYTHRHNA
jgi:hypothetical protein